MSMPAKPLSLYAKKTSICFQVSALAFLTPRLLLAGIGPFLRVYNIFKNVFLAEYYVLEYSRIHGIRVQPMACAGLYKDEDKIDTVQKFTVAVFGGKHLQTLEITVADNADYDGIQMRLLDSFVKFPDWILEAHWVSANSDSEECDALVLVFAHNYVEVWSHSSKTILFKVQNEERCLLYSARCFGSRLDNVQIASGTVFGQVILWNLYAQDEQNDGKALKRLIGHEGVIFNIQFSQNGSKVASVSDDRTIRVWSTTADDNMQHTIMHGHLSRVWDAMFVGDMVVSVSEDATCRVWNLDSGAQLACFQGHDVKHVWGLAVDSTHSVIATGGGDGGIRLWNIKSLAEQKSDVADEMITVSLIPGEKIGKRAEFPRAFAFVNDTNVLISSSYGRFILWSETDRTQKVILTDERVSSYVVMNTIPNSQAVIAATIDGDLLFFSIDQTFESIEWKHVVFGKIDNIFTFIDASNSDVAHIMVFTHQGNRAVWYTVSGLKSTKVGGYPTKTIYARFVLPPNVVVTTALLHITQSILAIGTRCGSILLYDASGDARLTSNLPSMLELLNTHSGESLTSILAVDSILTTDAQLRPIHLYTVGRDGHYCKYVLYHDRHDQKRVDCFPQSTFQFISKSIHGWHIDLIHQSRLTKGWLEQIILVDGIVLVGGFYDKKFFVYNETKKYEMASISCGGGHRQWKLQVFDGLFQHANFAFIRGGNLMVLAKRPLMTAPFIDSKIQDNYYGRETRAVLIVDLAQTATSTTRLVISAGEDGIMTLHKYDPTLSAGKILERLGTYRKHSGAIRCLCQIQRHDGQTMIFSAGAREDLKCWRLHVAKCEDVQYRVNFLDVATAPTVSQVSETRIMSVSAVRLPLASFGLNTNESMHSVERYYVIATACSDAIVRVWLFDQIDNCFIYFGESGFHGRCVQQVQLSWITECKFLVLFSGGTDGRVALWDLSRLAKDFLVQYQSRHIEKLNVDCSISQLDSPMATWKQHKSGIKAMHVWVDPTDTREYSSHSRLIVATGGDDNGLSILHIHICPQADSTIQAHLLNQTTHSSAHASSFGGVTVMDRDRILTVSIDQRLILWRIQEDTMDVIFENAVFVDVPDVGDMAVSTSGCGNGSQSVALVGMGMQILDLEF
ncbi:WD repeat-containing protein 6 [Batrachochytrium dendrobatidis]